MAVFLELEHIDQIYSSPRGPLRVLQDVSLSLAEGSILCVVGESGCGKSTLGKITAGLVPPTGGTIRYLGKEVHRLTRPERAAYRRAVQIIHQDPYTSLNPIRTVAQIIGAPLLRHRLVRTREELDAALRRLLAQVDLTPVEDFLTKYPHQLSGGQRQRVSVARALTVQPRFIVADEAVSMVDVSIRASLLATLLRLNRELGVGFLFITHDLSVARYFGWAGRVAVMYLGRIVELGPTPRVTSRPLHPYTRALLTALPVADPVAARSTEGRYLLRSMEVPSLHAIPSGCPFHPRCPMALPRCAEEVPSLLPAGDPQHLVACPVVAEQREAG